jgi:fused signal recognition particle receptor
MAFSLQRLTSGLKKTRSAWVSRLREIVGAGSRLDAGTLEALEETLIAGDVGTSVAEELIAGLRSRSARLDGPGEAVQYLKEAMVSLLPPSPERTRLSPEVVLLVGVNGTGKTTTAGKLAYRSRQEGGRIVLAACDTFRAAAIDQLRIWAERAGAEFVAGQPGGDPAAVAHDATVAAKARNAERLVIDTAGRLHTRTNLMAELEKIGRVVDKVMPGAPHEVWLVLDATTGQNGLRQAEEFHRAVPLTGVVLTKLDGTSRGGILFAVASRLGIPVRYVGLGEAVDDLDTFDPRQFVEALFADHAAAPAGS